MASLTANIPETFNQNLAELPAEYVLSHGLLNIASARLELFLSVAVNAIAQTNFWPPNETNWPNKASERIRWLEKAFASYAKLAPFKDRGTLLLKEAAAINSARNDIMHSAILGHDIEGALYVSRARVDKKGRRLTLEQGTPWSISDVGDVALRCTACSVELARLVVDLNGVLTET